MHTAALWAEAMWIRLSRSQCGEMLCIVEAQSRASNDSAARRRETIRCSWELVNDFAGELSWTACNNCAAINAVSSSTAGNDR
jgi:hypothetical protein